MNGFTFYNLEFIVQVINHRRFKCRIVGNNGIWEIPVNCTAAPLTILKVLYGVDKSELIIASFVVIIISPGKIVRCDLFAFFIYSRHNCTGLHLIFVRKLLHYISTVTYILTLTVIKRKSGICDNSRCILPGWNKLNLCD
ncbi:hypothetical protein D3C81_865110 [compost metagenome]